MVFIIWLHVCLRYLSNCQYWFFYLNKLKMSHEYDKVIHGRQWSFLVIVFMLLLWLCAIFISGLVVLIIQSGPCTACMIQLFFSKTISWRCHFQKHFLDNVFCFLENVFYFDLNCTLIINCHCFVWCKTNNTYDVPIHWDIYGAPAFDELIHYGLSSDTRYHH